MTNESYLIEKILLEISGKKHVIWDWNGTLLEDVEHTVNINNQLLSEHGLPPISRSSYQDRFSFPVRNYYEELGFDFQREPFENLTHRFVDLFLKELHNLPVKPHMRQTLSRLQRAGVQQSVLSAADQESLDRMMLHYELQPYFTFVFGINNRQAGSKIGRGLELMALSEIDAADTIMIGDTLHDLEVAEALGVEALLIADGHQSAQRLLASHSRVLTLL